MMMQDTCKKSMTEAFVNSFGSYPIGYVVGIMILPFTLTWLQEDILVANLAVAMIYTIVSFVRIYFLRRLFARLGFDDNIVRICGRLWKRHKTQSDA